MTRLLAFAAVAVFSADAGAAGFKAGVGRADITPEGPIWLAGYARQQAQRGRREQAEREGLVLAESDGDAPPLVLVCADAIESAPSSPSRSPPGRRSFGVPRDRFLLVGGPHSHAAPVVHGVLATMHELAGKDAEAVEEYTRRFESQALAAVRRTEMKDLSRRRGLQRGKAGFAANRLRSARRQLRSEPRRGRGPRRSGPPRRRPTAPSRPSCSATPATRPRWAATGKGLRRLARLRRSTRKPPSPARRPCSSPAAAATPTPAPRTPSSTGRAMA